MEKKVEKFDLVFTKLQNTLETSGEDAIFEPNSTNTPVNNPVEEEEIREFEESSLVGGLVEAVEKTDGIVKNTLETSGKDVKTTLRTSVKNPLFHQIAQINKVKSMKVDTDEELISQLDKMQALQDKIRPPSPLVLSVYLTFPLVSSVFFRGEPCDL
jgi:hypothetical protein